MAKISYNIATGKRKSSIARIFLKAGKGNFTINDRNIKDYFTREAHISDVYKPLILAKLEGNVDLKVTVEGGGNSGQAGAIRHGISRALLTYDESLRPILKENGLLTRDARKVERKLPGRKKARRSRQFSKR